MGKNMRIEIGDVLFGLPLSSMDFGVNKNLGLIFMEFSDPLCDDRWEKSNTISNFLL